MSDVSGFATHDVTIDEAARWIIAALVTIGIHAGVAAWMLRAEPVVAADNAPLAAIMLELADAPQSAMTEMNEITPDQKTATESAAQQEQKSQETHPEEGLVKSPPDPEVTKPVEEEKVEAKPAPVESVEAPLPAVQPKRGKRMPRRQRAVAQSKVSIRAQAQVRQSDRTAAAQTASGVSSLSPADWQSRLMAHLEQRKRYPSGARARGERGIVYVRFTIDSSGNVLSTSLTRSSGFSELDQEVLLLVRRASPLPAPPPGASRSVTAPVRFNAS